MDGYMGSILRVNLTKREFKAEPLPPKLARDYIGGTGLGNRIIYDEVPPSTDPLSPENKIVFATGPVTATNYPSGARYQICFKSPLTGILCDASSGGYWGADLKRAGYDALIVEGASPDPVYLWIHNGKVEFRNASPSLGSGCFKSPGDHPERDRGRENPDRLYRPGRGEDRFSYPVSSTMKGEPPGAVAMAPF